MFLWGGWGKEKERAGQDKKGEKFPARFLFFRLLLFSQGYPEEAATEERVLDRKSIFIDNSTECGGVFEQLARYTMRYIQLTPDNSNPR